VRPVTREQTIGELVNFVARLVSCRPGRWRRTDSEGLCCKLTGNHSDGCAV